MYSLNIKINGEARQFAHPTSVAGLVEHLGHAGKRIAVERNGEIAPRSQHAEVMLKENDVIEIVVAVGGG